MQIKQELEFMASQLENLSGSSESPNDPFPRDNILADADTARFAMDKAKELSLNLKSITQLYNDYAVPFNLWEVRLSLFLGGFFLDPAFAYLGFSLVRELLGNKHF